MATKVRKSNTELSDPKLSMKRWMSPLFARRVPLAALIEIMLTWTAIVPTIVACARISRLVAQLLVPLLRQVFDVG
jgi:tryptophan-rich sensory protein